MITEDERRQAKEMMDDVAASLGISALEAVEVISTVMGDPRRHAYLKVMRHLAEQTDHVLDQVRQVVDAVEIEE